MNTLQYVPENIHLIIHIQAKEEHLQEVLLSVYETISPTHKEDGCLEYRLFHEGTSVVIKGEWHSKMALDMHLLMQFHLHCFENILPDLCDNISIKSFKEIEPPITALSLS